METKEYFEKVMLDYNQNRKGSSLLKYFRGCVSFQIINRVIFHRWLAVLSVFFSKRSHPAQTGEGFDAPPTL